MTKKPGIMIAIGTPKKNPDAMPMPSMPGKSGPPKPPMDKSPMPDPKDDGDLDDGGGIPPEAVSYRSADQKCSGCTFYQGGQCSKLKMPVEDDAGCNLYDAGGDDQQMPSPDDDSGAMGMGQ